MGFNSGFKGLRVEDVTTAAAARVLLRDIGKLVDNARVHVESVM